ncbi:hypothetical protein roselon_01332 [Roseibacterium elongatum DSM 19469]|uniref:DUF6468 domain-containing protein n=1 Tax=Roseicyclus elongatus DSM 19469 TaxID=1294273 RepID=W8SME6_9RHOB|nr:DUF6468 domain-containing protein [Roseibacterium elongatum]AHM03720.1 hypothetical protein roselon_01332 [Roseibacterium elongatum DSM 19469]
MTSLFSYAADILLFLASFGAAAYCMILSRRLARLSSFDKGIGGAIAVMSAQVDDMQRALAEARTGSDGAGQHLNDLVRQARDISAELEMMIAACHDFAETAIEVQSAAAPAASDPADPPADMPIFGSRRNGATDTEATAQGATPLFRHRPQSAEA